MSRASYAGSGIHGVAAAAHSVVSSRRARPRSRSRDQMNGAHHIHSHHRPSSRYDYYFYNYLIFFNKQFSFLFSLFGIANFFIFFVMWLNCGLAPWYFDLSSFISVSVIAFPILFHAIAHLSNDKSVLLEIGKFFLCLYFYVHRCIGIRRLDQHIH